MDKRMKKEELIQLIKTLKINNEEFWVLSSGGLILRGIYPDAGDLDIAVTTKGLEQLKANYDLIQKENGWYIVSEKVECICVGDKNDQKYQPELIDGIYVQNINEYLEYLYSSTRDKDKKRIKLVEEYIKTRWITMVWISNYCWFFCKAY